MSTKKSHARKVGAPWPTFNARQSIETTKMQETIAAAAQVSQIMKAASVVPQVRQKKLMHDAVAAAKQSAFDEPDAKDNYFEENKAWDEVEGIRISCFDLLRTAMALAPLLKERELLKLVKNVPLLSRNIKAIVRDTETLSKVWGKVRELHKGKTGGSKNQKEMLSACSVYSEYVDFCERYDSALLPIIVHASEQLQEALWELQTINPELAHDINVKIQQNLSSIQKIVHATTGADTLPSPGAIPELVENIASVEVTEVAV